MKEILFSTIRGQGDIVIVLHGLFGSSDNLGRVATELAKEYQVHALDLRNHGKSAHSDEMNYALMADDVMSYMDKMGITHACLIGHSMGGKVAMRIALHYPERINKLIVVDIAPVDYVPHHEGIFKGLLSVDFDKNRTRSNVDKILAQSIKEKGIRQFLLKNLQTGEAGRLSWKMNLKAIHNNYQNILKGMSEEFNIFEKSVLFIAGGLSDYIKAEYKEQTIALFPKAEIKVIAGTTHWLHAEKPRTFINICSRFLQK